MGYLSKYDRTAVLIELIADMDSLVKLDLVSPASAVNTIVACAKKHEDYPKEDAVLKEIASTPSAPPPIEVTWPEPSPVEEPKPMAILPPVEATFTESPASEDDIPF